MEEPKLYVLATPLGNRDDITIRAKKVLEEARVLFAEDTREARKLLEMLSIPAQGKTLRSYAAHNMKEATAAAVRFLEEGHCVCLLSDRGTPAISDPGADMVRLARESGFDAIPIPGVSAIACLWSVSGLGDREFLFAGFLSESNSERKKFLNEVAQWNRPVVLYESPHRIRRTLEELGAEFPSGRILVGREMTKSFEEYRWYDLAKIPWDSFELRGEFTLVLVPRATPKATESLESWIDLRTMSEREWSKRVSAATGVSAKDAYNALQEKKREHQM